MKNFFNLIIGVFIGLIAAGLLYLSVRTPAGEPVTLVSSPTPEPIVVYVSGAVKLPGVYRLPVESRLVDAVQIAGGFMDGADIAQVNLAKVLEDGEQVVIPGGTQLATPQLTIGGNGLLFTPTPPGGTKVNINLATMEELDQLPGIGPTAAQKIVQYRTDNGPFLRIEDLLKIPGIGPGIFDEIKSMIIVSASR